MKIISAALRSYLNPKTHLPWSCNLTVASWIFWVLEIPSTQHCFDSGVKQCTHITSQVTICSRNEFPSNSNQCWCSVDTATFYNFWLNVKIFGTHQIWAHIFLNIMCSWIIVSTLPTLIPLLDAISHTVFGLFPKISSSTLNVHIVYSCWLNINMQ
jgi:hypothetical protein